MTLSVVNNSGINIDLFIGLKKYLIKAYDQPQIIEVDSDACCITLKRAEALSPPDYKQMLLSELLGGVARLFSVSHKYIVDVSCQYRFSCDTNNFAEIIIVRKQKEPLTEITYDTICATSQTLDLSNVHYLVENKQEIMNTYKKSRRTAHNLMYLFIELLFLMLGMGIAYPVLLALYSVTNMLLFKVLMVLFPLFWGGMIALIAILPLYCFHRYEDGDFYKHFKHEKIQSIFKD